MKLYKYKSLAPLEHVLDIVVNQRLFCSMFDDLNDPLEGVFRTDFYITFKNFSGGADTKATVAGTSRVAARVCALSASISNLLLWAHYADGHRGVAIEIEFPHEMISNLNEVKYLSSLGAFDTASEDRPSAEEVLSTKTKHWEHEEEFRIIQESPHYEVRDRITAVHFGQEMSELHRGILADCIPEGIKIMGTRIDSATLQVESTGPVNLPRRKGPSR